MGNFLLFVPQRDLRNGHVCTAHIFYSQPKWGAFLVPRSIHSEAGSSKGVSVCGQGTRSHLLPTFSQVLSVILIVKIVKNHAKTQKYLCSLQPCFFPKINYLVLPPYSERRTQHFSGLVVGLSSPSLLRGSLLPVTLHYRPQQLKGRSPKLCWSGRRNTRASH